MKIAGPRNELRADQAAAPQGRYNGELALCTIVGVTDAGDVVVRISDSCAERLLFARTMVSVPAEAQGRRAVLQYERGDLEKAVLLGLLSDSNDQTGRPARLVLTAEQEIVLQCGTSTITLTRDGKVFIKGTYVVSRSTGVNRVNGASVQIN